ncbi:MAG: rhomboid family intramembrane serine protease [Fibromonadales bacterium]|nr:rhomboid family intramembrane serine protease [Fibromonadales bacterium]
MLGLTSFKHLPRTMQAILLINAAIYLLIWIGGPNVRGLILGYGAFAPSHAHQLWRFLSYAFVHEDFWHILFNMLMFWMFATDVCKALGEKNFTTLYLVSAIFASVFSLACYALGIMNGHPMIGASGALFGVMAAYAFLFPERIILMFFIIPMKIKYAIWIFIAIDLFMARSNDGIAHFAHLGGVLSGFLFMQAWSRPKQQKTYSQEFFKEKARQQWQHKPLEGELYKGSSNAKEERLNEILEKINRNGLQSLSQEERDFLQWFGQQNKRRC